MTSRCDLKLTTLHVGVDSEKASRFANSLDDFTPGPSAKLFTSEEHTYCHQSAHPAMLYAATWCAKEAAVKALWPWIQLDPRRVSVITSKEGRQTLRIDGDPLSTLGLTALVSVAHSATTAVAAVIAWSDASSSGTEHLAHPTRPANRC